MALKPSFLGRKEQFDAVAVDAGDIACSFGINRLRVPLDVAAVHCRGDTEQVVVVEVVVLEKDAVALIVGIGEFLGVTRYQIAFGGSVIVHFYLSSNLVDKCLGGVGMIAVTVVAVIRNMA